MSWILMIILAHGAPVASNRHYDNAEACQGAADIWNEAIYSANATGAAWLPNPPHRRRRVDHVACKSEAAQ